MNNFTIKSHHLQVLESTEKIDHNQDSNGASKNCLTYTATEQSWLQFLSAAKLLENRASNAHARNLRNSNSELNQNQNQFKKYCTISIMGPQSSGKSTLFNKCFATNFDVMDCTQGRKQVTTGIWFGSSPKSSNLLLMDLEGTDSYERHENRGNFERQTSLMALALSEVLIINMWSSDIGKAAGMNVDTLRSILSANLRLFNPEGKTLLLFVIREQSCDETLMGVTPARILKQHLTSIIEKIWIDIEKPKEFMTKSLYDLFDIEFYFLPLMVYQPKQFNVAIDNLFQMFVNPNHDAYLFKNKPYHLSKCVPPEGLCTYTKSIFNAIANDESLNIPNQQKLLSAYRCEHAMNSSYEQFLAECNQKNLTEKFMSQNYIQNFGQILYPIIAKNIRNYKDVANKYNQQEMNEKYEQLLSKISDYIKLLFTNYQLKHITTDVSTIYEQQMIDHIKRANKNPMTNTTMNGNGHIIASTVGYEEPLCVNNLQQIVIQVGESIRELFSQRMQECIIRSDAINVDGFDLPFKVDKDFYWNEMHLKLRAITKNIQNKQVMLLQNENTRLLRDELLSSREIKEILRSPNMQMWSQISKLRLKFYHQFLFQRIVPKLRNLMFDKKVLQAKLESLVLECDHKFKERIISYLQRLQNVLETHFKNKFNKTETGAMRAWKQDTDIEGLYEAAKTECFELLRNAQSFVIRGDSSANNGLEVLSIRFTHYMKYDQEFSEIEDGLMQSCDNELQIAIQRAREASRGGFLGGAVPSHPVTWLVFAWVAKDEIWGMLTNPLYLVMVLFVLLCVVVVYQAHEMGIDVKTVATQIGNQVFKVVMKKLKDHFEHINTIAPQVREPRQHQQQNTPDLAM